MDRCLEELAKFYGIEVNERPGCVIIEKDGTERLAKKSDAADIFGLNFFRDKEIDWDNDPKQGKVKITKKTPWNITLKDRLFDDNSTLEVA